MSTFVNVYTKEGYEKKNSEIHFLSVVKFLLWLDAQPEFQILKVIYVYLLLLTAMVMAFDLQKKQDKS